MPVLAAKASAADPLTPQITSSSSQSAKAVSSMAVTDAGMVISVIPMQVAKALGPPALLVLLDVIAELGVHEGLTAALAAGLQILCPQKLLVDAVSQELLADVIEVRHLPGGAGLRCLGEQRLL